MVSCQSRLIVANLAKQLPMRMRTLLSRFAALVIRNEEPAIEHLFCVDRRCFDNEMMLSCWRKSATDRHTGYSLR